MASSYDNSPGKIFIGGISPNTTQDTIQKYFEAFGELCDCVLMQDKATGKSRCFGFVTYKDANILDDVLSKKHMIDGKEIDCKRAIPRDQHPDTGKDGSYKTKKLFVGGLTQTTTEEQFRTYFEQFGTIEDSVIMVDKETGKSRGFGFVTFDSEESVDRVVERYNDNKIDGKWVECKKAQAKDVMSAGLKKGSKYGGGGGGRDQGSGSHSRHDRNSSSRGQYYQTSPTTDRSGKRSSRNTSSQDYDYQYSRGGGGGGYSSNSGRSSNYDKSGPSGYDPYYGYSQGSMGYDPNAYNQRGNPSGYNYGGDYAQGYNGSYPNPYSYMPNGPYNAYSQPYGQQGYDPSMYGMPQGGQSASNPTASNPSAKPAEGQTAQMSGNPSSQYPPGVASYGADAGYNPAGYNYGANDYAGGNAAYMGYGVPGQGGDMSQGRNMQGGKYPSNQVQSPSQMGSYPKSGQSEIGPVKGGNKKTGVEQRFYQPY